MKTDGNGCSRMTGACSVRDVCRRGSLAWRLLACLKEDSLGDDNTLAAERLIGRGIG